MVDANESVVVEFLADYLRDVESGISRALAEYLERWPGHEEEIAREYFTLRDRERCEDVPHGVADDGCLGSYRLLEEIGRGGQATVHLAVDERLGRKVALKIFRTDSWSRVGNALQRFRREAEAVSRLEHPGICTLYETGQVGDTAFLAMRYVSGRTLAEEIARRLAVAGEERQDSSTDRRTLHDDLVILEKVARALHVAHGAGITHRDVKPGNVMLTEEGEPVLLDFGLARDESDPLPPITRTGDAFGTPSYMSPEQLAGRTRELDHRTDVWSLGVVAYELLTLKGPFDEPTRQLQMRAILESEPRDPRVHRRTLSQDLTVVLQTALTKELDRRYQSALEFAEELRRVREHEPIHARPANAWLRLRRWSQRKPGLAASLAFAFLALIVGLGVSLWLLGETKGALGREQGALDREREALDELVLRSFEPGMSEMIRRERTLWPTLPERIPEHVAWLRDARRQLDLAPRFDTLIGEALVVRPIEEHAHLQTSSSRAERAHARLSSLIVAVSRRNETARTLVQTTLRDALPLWERCREDLASDERFAGFTLPPQLGLIPLGRNAQGLWEFWHVLSGSEPQRAEDTGTWKIEKGTGVVLVLVPGGEITLAETLKERRIVDGEETVIEIPYAVRVELDPYFLSKYELTRSQWLWVEHEFWSGFQITNATLAGSDGTTRPVTDTHPIEELSYRETWGVLSKLALVLPTEAQWEHACRAGTTTLFSTGSDDPNSLQGFANVLDAGCRRDYVGSTMTPVEGLDDGFALHAPVGSYRPNGFGLHDMHGNVMEWCWDEWSRIRDDLPVRASDGLRGRDAGSAGSRTASLSERDQDDLDYVVRGGSYYEGADFAESGMRNGTIGRTVLTRIGVRPARAVER